MGWSKYCLLIVDCITCAQVSFEVAPAAFRPHGGTVGLDLSSLQMSSMFTTKTSVKI